VIIVILKRMVLQGLPGWADRLRTDPLSLRAGLVPKAFSEDPKDSNGEPFGPMEPRREGSDIPVYPL